MRKAYSNLSKTEIKELRNIFNSGNTHCASIENSNRNISSYDSALCLYDYADIILGGSKYVETDKL